MADPELGAIRQRIMQERGTGNYQNSDQQKTREKAKREAEEERQMTHTQLLTSEARAKHKTVNVHSLLSKRRKGGDHAGSSRNSGDNPGSSVGRHPLPTPEEGSQPHPRPEEGSQPHPRPKGVHICGGSHRGSGPKLAPHSKHTKASGSEVLHGKGNLLCPYLFVIEPSKDLWCHPELGVDVSRHNVRDADMAYLRPRSAVELVNLAFCDLARVPAVIQALGDKAQGYEDMQIRAEEAEERCRSLTRELAQLKLDHDATHRKLEEELGRVREELKVEIDYGHGFFESLGGQRFMKFHDECVISKYEESEESKPFRERVISEFEESEKSKPFRRRVISEFKGSAEFENAVEDASVHVFDDCLAFCRERLVNSGRFPGEKFEFLDPDWVEMIESSGDSVVAQASQGTNHLPTAPGD